mgnify:CR=1 FL=1
MRRLTVVASIFLAAFCLPSLGTECDSARPEWLLCEDFETGAGDWDTWWTSRAHLGGPVTVSQSGDHANRVRRADPATRPLQTSRRPTGFRTP